MLKSKWSRALGVSLLGLAMPVIAAARPHHSSKALRLSGPTTSHSTLSTASAKPAAHHARHLSTTAGKKSHRHVNLHRSRSKHTTLHARRVAHSTLSTRHAHKARPVQQPVM